MFRSTLVRDLVLVLLVCSIAFWWRLGRIGLIDPDEPFYAQTAREMVATGDWVTPQIFGEPQFEKPILFYWLTAASFVVLGETEFAARVPAALPATLLVFLVYGFVRRIATARAGLLAAVVLATGLEFTVMSRLMLTDIALALFIAGSMFSYWLALEAEPEQRGRWMLIHFACAGLAALTKGPVGTIVTLLATGTFAFLTKRPMPYRRRSLWLGLLIYLVIAVPWYAVMLAKYGYYYFEEFFIHENWERFFHAEHKANNHFWYYIAILALGSIPWLPALAAATLRACRGNAGDERRTFFWSWIVTSFVFLTAAQSKLPSYIFYVFVPLAIVVALTLDDILTLGFRNRLEKRLVFGFAAFQALVGFAIPLAKSVRIFSGPALLVAACLFTAFILLWRGKLAGWIAASALGTAGLLVGALTWSADHVEEFSSARPVARRMLEMRRADEPLLAGTFLARGIHFYTKLPVTVLANKPNPFNWTQHKNLAVVAGGKELLAFLDTHHSALCTVRRGDWPQWRNEDDTPFPEEPNWSGDNAIVRLEAAPHPAPIKD
jgi:4-amino-4-deoxy-L-arabinose transferase-like glycosyltransferase